MYGIFAIAIATVIISVKQIRASGNPKTDNLGSINHQTKYQWIISFMSCPDQNFSSLAVANQFQIGLLFNKTLHPEVIFMQSGLDHNVICLKLSYFILVHFNRRRLNFDFPIVYRIRSSLCDQLFYTFEIANSSCSHQG